MTDAELTGLVITECRAIEQALRSRGATGNGLRELVESKSGLLSPEARQLLRWIGTVRNSFAHQGAPEAELGFDPEFFTQSCRTVLAELQPPLRSSAKRAAAPARFAAPPDRFRIAIWIPGLQLGYPLWTLWCALGGVRLSLLALALYAALIPLGLRFGFRTIGWAVPLGIYVLGLIEYHRGRPLRWLLWLPLLNLGYFLCQVLFRLRWARLGGALAALLLTGGGLALTGCRWFAGGAALLVLGYGATVLLYCLLRGAEETP